MRSFFWVWLAAINVWAVSPADGTCGHLRARTLDYVCGRMAYASSKFDCLAAGKNQYLDECALGACDRFNQDEPTVACIEAIAGQIYTLSEVLECDGYESPSTTVKCFRARGQSYARAENLKAARQSGERQGSRLALESTLDASAEEAAAQWAQVLAREKANKDRDTRSWNQGYTQARQSETPLDGQTFERGLALGYQWAVETAATGDEPKGYFEEKKATLERGATGSTEIDLKADRTQGFYDDSVSDLAGGRTSPPSVSVPAFPFPEPVPAVPPSLGASDSLPWTPSVATLTDVSLDSSPCLPSDFECRKELRKSAERAYQGKLSARYREAFVGAFNPAAKAAYLSEPTEGNKEAFNHGSAKGTEDRGTLEGFLRRYPSEQRRANALGRTRFSSDLSRSYWVQVKRVSIRSPMGENLSPGYAAEIVVEIENLGGQASPSGLFRLRGSSPEATFERSTRFLPSLAPGTRATIRNALSVAAKDWQLGKTYPLEVSLEKLQRDGAFEPRGSKTTLAQAQLTVEVVSMVPQSTFGLNAPTTTQVRLRNTSGVKLKGVSFTVESSPQSAQVRKGERVSLPDLQPEEEWETQMEIVPNLWTHDLVPTLFRVTVWDADQKPLSWQKYSLPVDLQRTVALSLQMGEGDVSNKTIRAVIPQPRHDAHRNRQGPASSTSVFRVVVDCRQDIGLSDGYAFRYEGASHSGSYYTGTVSAPITSCKAGQRKVLTQGRLITNHNESLRGTTSALRFKLTKNGGDVQGVQVFIAVH